MSIRARIGYINTDGVIKSIYLHNNGQPSLVAPVLVKAYNESEKVVRLIELGDISVLGTNLEPLSPDKPHTFSSPQEDTVVAYHRDRGEPWDTGNKPCRSRDRKAFLSAADRCGAEYVYLYEMERMCWTYCGCQGDDHIFHECSTIVIN